jgi:hypothetical protein
MLEYLKLLGLKVRDVVSGFSGVVTSITFDLYGCVQALVSPTEVDKDGKQREREWFDCKRLIVTDKTPIMQQPTFAAVPGGQDLPNQRSMPKP